MVDTTQKTSDEEEWTTATSGSISPENPAFHHSTIANDDTRIKDNVEHQTCSKVTENEELTALELIRDTVLIEITPDNTVSNERAQESSLVNETINSPVADTTITYTSDDVARNCSESTGEHASLFESNQTSSFDNQDDELRRKMEEMELSSSSSFLPFPLEMERSILRTQNASSTSMPPSRPQLLSSSAVESETDTWLKQQLQLHRQHARQPSIIAEEKDLTEEGDSDHHKRLAKAAEKTQLPLPPTIKSWDNMQALLQEAERIEEATKLKPNSPLRRKKEDDSAAFIPQYKSTYLYATLSKYLLRLHYTPFTTATWIGFWALLHVTCANHVLTPMRDAIALQIGVAHVPKLTLLSMLMAFCSSVPIGWLFEAPDPSRRRLWKKMGLTRGETQGTSLALFYRCFAFVLVSYAAVFELMHLLDSNGENRGKINAWMRPVLNNLPVPVLQTLALAMYVAFFLIVHLMKLHSISLMWGVTTEAMEYEEVAQKKTVVEQTKTRLQRMALVSFGGTVGGILGR
jgi:hypothetical protein